MILLSEPPIARYLVDYGDSRRAYFLRLDEASRFRDETGGQLQEIVYSAQPIMRRSGA